MAKNVYTGLNYHLDAELSSKRKKYVRDKTTHRSEPLLNISYRYFDRGMTLLSWRDFPTFHIKRIFSKLGE